MWSAINSAASAAFVAWLGLLDGLPDFLQLCLTAVPVTVFALLVFRYASSQSGIRAAKDGIKGHLLELWLYRDEPRVLLRAQGQVALSSLEYLGHSLAPLAVMLVPMVLLIAQVEAHFAWRSLAPAEDVIVTATVDGGQPVSVIEATLSAPPGITVETPPLRIDERQQVLWRIAAASAGEHWLDMRIGESTVARRIAVGPDVGGLAPVIYREGDWRVLAHPAEPPLPADGAVEALEVAYPRRGAVFLGLSGATWLLFGVSLALGYASRGLFGVTF